MMRYGFSEMLTVFQIWHTEDVGKEETWQQLIKHLCWGSFPPCRGPWFISDNKWPKPHQERIGGGAWGSQQRRQRVLQTPWHPRPGQKRELEAALKMITCPCDTYYHLGFPWAVFFALEIVQCNHYWEEIKFSCKITMFYFPICKMKTVD